MTRQISISGIININMNINIKALTLILIGSLGKDGLRVRVRLNCSHDKNNLSDEGKHSHPPHKLFTLHERWSSSTNSISQFISYEETEICSTTTTMMNSKSKSRTDKFQYWNSFQISARGSVYLILRKQWEDYKVVPNLTEISNPRKTVSFAWQKNWFLSGFTNYLFQILLKHFFFVGLSFQKDNKAGPDLTEISNPPKTISFIWQTMHILIQLKAKDKKYVWNIFKQEFWIKLKS